MLKKIPFLLLFSFCLLHVTYSKTVVLLTGLPCAGKTTIANELHRLLPNSIILDGDEVRKTINKDLSFTKKDREEHLRRVVDITKLVSNSSELIILSFVSPYESIRQYMRKKFEKDNIHFYEIFIHASLETCINRDVKGMYKKALNKEIPHFTGISSPYENPKCPDLVCYTEKSSLAECTDNIFSLLKIQNPLKPHAIFIGRWAPFHKGHWEIMKKVYQENPYKPLLVLVRERKEEYWSAKVRKAMVETALNKMNIPSTVKIIPDIDSVNWGRSVGYTPRMIDVDKKVATISGTKIRQMLKENNNTWKQYVCPGVDEIILKDYQQKH